MMDFFLSYGLFALKLISVVLAILFTIAGVAFIVSRNRDDEGAGAIVITNLSDELDDAESLFLEETLDPASYKLHLKQKKAAEKEDKRAEKKKAKEIDAKAPVLTPPRLFVVEFTGDLEASEALHLRECINAILTTATERDEVLVKVESHGGYVHSYGLAASQLARLRDNHIHLTVSIDEVAASGGYLMAAVANKIIAAPFAIVGSIGVLAEIPNFHRLLKKHDIDYETHTAGRYKRTLTLFGENTDEARRKFREELTEVHQLFQQHLLTYRQLDLAKVATGEHWHAKDAIKLDLVDEIKTSDDFIFDYYRAGTGQIYRIEYVIKPSLSDKLQRMLDHLGKSLLNTVLNGRFPKLLKD